MQQRTIDFGIDLGTTNSAIARVGKRGVQPIRNRYQQELTPSVVAVAPGGQLLVGEDALARPGLMPARHFKRLMGTRERVLGADGVGRSAEELSAEILKELKAAVRIRFDLELEHAVITVPAMFMQPQCEATHRAAELAGLTAASLLQEPIAAASAYLDEDPEDGTYLVYDLGGGTFDASVVRLDRAQMMVLAHGGDNYLGGADFDREILDWLLDQLSRRHGSLACLEEAPARHRLLLACEAARKRLSTQSETPIDLGELDLPVAQVPLDQSTLESLLSRHVSRTLSLARERLEQAEVRPRDLQRVLLVGGPTLTPYVRRRLREEFEAPLATELDPMTVVAAGAAIHAGSLLLPERRTERQSRGDSEAELELFYDPVTSEAFAPIAGRVRDPEGFTGEVRIRSSAGDWDTAWLPLQGGAFSTEVEVSASGPSEFQVELRDSQGRRVGVRPAVVVMRRGTVPAQPVTPYRYGVELQDGTVGWILNTVVSLPAVSELVALAAAKTVAAGSSDVLSVFFVEGSSDVASDNIRVGELEISGAALPRTLREGDRVEVRIRMDESRLCKARVSIPLLDLDYEVKFASIIEEPRLEQLDASLAETAELLADLEPAVAADDARAVHAARGDLEQLEADLEHVYRGEAGESHRLGSKLAHLKGTIRGLSSRYGARIAYLRAQSAIDRAERIAVQFDDRVGETAAQELRSEAEGYLRQQDESRLRDLVERADEIFWRHYLATRECWAGLVQFLRSHRSYAADRGRYHDCLQRAEECLEREDYEGVRIHGLDAFNYLPAHVRGRSGAAGAGLRLL